MYCPECRAEFPEELKRCPDCDKDLVAEVLPAPAEELEWEDTVVVFETNDPSAMLVAKSILESEKIPFVSVGDRSQDLIGLGRLFSGSNPLVGEMRIEVPREFEKWARRMLQPAAGDSSTAAAEGGSSEARSAPRVSWSASCCARPRSRVPRLPRRAVRFARRWMDTTPRRRRFSTTCSTTARQGKILRSGTSILGQTIPRSLCEPDPSRP